MTDLAAQSGLEASVLGAVLQGGPAALDDLPPGFGPLCFTRLEYQHTFDAAARLARQLPVTGEAFDLDLLATQLRLDDSTWRDIADTRRRAAGADLPLKARALLDARKRRDLSGTLREHLDHLEAGADPDKVSAALAARIGAAEAGTTMAEGWKDSFHALADQAEQEQLHGSRRISTGLAAVDGLLSIRPGNLVVIAAMEKSGKTTLARQVARKVASEGRRVLCHSLEMTEAENVALDLGATLGCEPSRFTGALTLTDAQWSQVDRLGVQLQGLLTNSRHSSLDAICLATERLHRRAPLTLVVVDYLQLVQVEGGRGTTREQEVSKVSRGLKRLAQRLDVPVIALSQLNREYIRRGAPDPRADVPPPRLSDLRESGAIAQDANAVCFIHNPKALHPEPRERMGGPWHFIVAAQRLGRTGEVCLRPVLSQARFEDWGSRVP